MSRLVPYFVGEDDAAVTILAPDHRHVEEITFEISGDPRPLQRSRWAGFFNRVAGSLPRLYNPLRRVMNTFKVAAREVLSVMPGDNPVFGDNTFLEVNCWFVIKRPISHFNHDGTLRLGAQRFPTSSDVDNLVKLVLDALQGILYRDDRCIVVLFAGKSYPSENDPHTNFGKTVIKACVR
eukprot:scaffold61898_cov35-Attheya_sp.AAC.1